MLYLDVRFVYRDMKLELERRRREQEELESCSFAPDLRPQNAKGASKQKSFVAAIKNGHNEKPNTDKIPMPAHAREGAIMLPRKQGSFSYDTPYVQQSSYEEDLNGSTNYNDTYNTPSYGSATRLYFGDDDTPPAKVGHPTISPENKDYNIKSHGILLGAAPSGVVMNGHRCREEHFDDDLDGYEDDEYGVEYELDESGDIINATRY